MEKINFQNGQQPAINGTNLNIMQNNIEAEINRVEGIVEDNQFGKHVKQLYYDNTASYVSATLNENISNFDVLVIVGQSSDGYQCSTVIYKPYIGAICSLVSSRVVDNNTIYNKQASFKISSGTVIESIENHQLQGNTSISSGNYIRLRAVLGIKINETTNEIVNESDN